MTYMIESQVFKGEMYIKASDHHRAMSEAVAAEREACAQVAEDGDHIVNVKGYYAQLGDAAATARNIAEAIRARGAA